MDRSPVHQVQQRLAMADTAPPRRRQRFARTEGNLHCRGCTNAQEYVGEWRRWKRICVLPTDASRRSLNWTHSSHKLHMYHNATQLFFAIYIAIQPFLFYSSPAYVSSIFSRPCNADLLARACRDLCSFLCKFKVAGS